MSPIFTVRKTELKDLDALVEMRIALLREVGNISPGSNPRELEAVIEAHRRYFSESIPARKYLGLAAEAED